MQTHKNDSDSSSLSPSALRPFVSAHSRRRLSLPNPTHHDETPTRRASRCCWLARVPVLSSLPPPSQCSWSPCRLSPSPLLLLLPLPLLSCACGARGADSPRESLQSSPLLRLLSPVASRPVITPHPEVSTPAQHSARFEDRSSRRRRRRRRWDSLSLPPQQCPPLPCLSRVVRLLPAHNNIHSRSPLSLSLWLAFLPTPQESKSTQVRPRAGRRA